MAIIELATDAYSIILDGNQWCRVFLVDGQQRRELGAESIELVLSRLRTALKAESISPVAGEVDGMPVSWVTSLAEGHGSLYYGESEDGLRVLVVQDGSGNTLGKLVLTAELRRRWIELLDDEYNAHTT